MSSIKSIFQSTQLWAEQRRLDIVAYDEIGSTNTEAKADAADLNEAPRLYLAAHQTHGRGRNKNQWLDTGAGENLLSSWSFHLPQPPQAITGPRIGEALYRSASAVWPSMDWSLKAPNDLYLGEDKVGGILLETVSQGSFHRVIIGLGLNVLNHPRAIANATHFIAEGSPDGLTEGEWYQFLDVLFSQFQIALEDVILPHLNRDVRNCLLKALNAFPGKAEPFLDVSPSGDLILGSGTIPWMSQ